jgi:hypothetical protein
MVELHKEVLQGIEGGFKLHFNLLVTGFTAVGAFIISGPVGAGMIVAAAISAQGTGQLIDMYDEVGNQQR